MMPAGNRSSLRVPAGIFACARRFLLVAATVACAWAPSARAADDMNATISGRALFEGSAPARPRFTMTVDRVCDALNPKGRLSDALLVDASGGLANVIVAVRSGIEKGVAIPPPPATAVTLDLKGCVYTPHVAALRVGQELLVRNHDATLHTAHARAGENPPFSASMPGEGSEIRKVLARPGLGVRVRCDRHPWEAAYLAAFEHPWFAVSAADGSFAITGLPEGEYTLEAWHETLGTRTAKVEVDEGGKATVNFSFAGN